MKIAFEIDCLNLKSFKLDDKEIGDVVEEFQLRFRQGDVASVTVTLFGASGPIGGVISGADVDASGQGNG